MKLVQDIAGYDLGQADMFRRAIGRKIPEEMAILIPHFVKDGEAQGIDKDAVNTIAEWLSNAAAYQFNKSHSAAYGYTCYQTAYLKAHYPAEYFCAYLNAYKGDKQEDLLVYYFYFPIARIRMDIRRKDFDTVFTGVIDVDEEVFLLISLTNPIRQPMGTLATKPHI